MEMIGSYSWGRETRRIKHYSSAHDILLVGEGDFSFSKCLAFAFGSAANIVATSLDSYDELTMKYRNAKENLATLKARGAFLLHGVDATKMSVLGYLRWRKFHRIIFNFPHAGFVGREDNPEVIRMHQELVSGFLSNARSMLRPDGEIHINHKITVPFNNWQIKDLASWCSLSLIGEDEFRIQDYPGYENKRGSGSKPDEPFPLGECRTFKFKRCRRPAEEIREVGREQDMVQTMSHNLPNSFVLDYAHLSNELKLQNDHTDESHRIFGLYLNHVEETFGSSSDDVDQSIREVLRLGRETYRSAAPGRSWRGYIRILEELHNWSLVRSERLRQML